MYSFTFPSVLFTNYPLKGPRRGLSRGEYGDGNTKRGAYYTALLFI